MRHAKLWPCAMIALILGAAPGDKPVPAPAPAPPSDLVVHEWGTFLGMSGSDGVTLEGMYHEEHALPGFVHARSRDERKLSHSILKGETPVIYFYTDRKQTAHVRVGFPSGLWTQWYPQVQALGLPKGTKFLPLGGFLDDLVWCPEILPASAGVPTPAPPATSADALWNHAREVDAAYVRTINGTTTPPTPEVDRFLFYRGLGTAPLPVTMDASAGGTLAIDAASKHGVAHVFTLRVEGGKGAYAYRPALSPGERATGLIPSMDGARPLDEFAAGLADDLAARLVASGLYPKEARAMVNTWRESYFRTEGVRSLFILPRAWTDGFIPLSILPRPKEIVRVMVGRVELLTPARERLAEAAVRDLASTESAVRLRAFRTLRDQGRYVEPVLRRVLASTKDEAVRALCRKLLDTAFVTEIRADTHAASDGRRTPDDPARMQSQLTALAREVGLDARVSRP